MRPPAIRSHCLQSHFCFPFVNNFESFYHSGPSARYKRESGRDSRKRNAHSAIDQTYFVIVTVCGRQRPHHLMQTFLNDNNCYFEHHTQLIYVVFHFQSKRHFQSKAVKRNSEREKISSRSFAFFVVFGVVSPCHRKIVGIQLGANAVKW